MVAAARGATRPAAQAGDAAGPGAGLCASPAGRDRARRARPVEAFERHQVLPAEGVAIPRAPTGLRTALKGAGVTSDHAVLLTCSFYYLCHFAGLGAKTKLTRGDRR